MKNQIINAIRNRFVFPQIKESLVFNIVESNVGNHTKEDHWMDLMRAASNTVEDLVAFGVINNEQSGAVYIDILEVMGGE